MPLYSQCYAEVASLSQNLDGADKQVKKVLLLDYGEVVNALGSITGNTTVNLELGNVVTATATSAVAWTFSNPSPTSNLCSFSMLLYNGAAGTQTWPSVKWPGGTPPTLSTSGWDLLSFLTTDAGSTWMGVCAAKDLK